MRINKIDILKSVRRNISLKMRARIIKNDVEAYSKMKYYEKFGFYPDLTNPTTFNEKTLWIAMNYHNPLYTKCADKVRVRQYLEEKIGKEKTDALVCKKYGIWDNPEDIDFDSLPNSFVLKSNHASGQVIICDNKATLDINKTKKQLKSWLKINFYYLMGEWQYKYIKPLIICEELLDSDIVDYRVFCFEGKPTYIKVTKHNSNSPGGYDYNMYYTNWEKTDFKMSQSYGELDFVKPDRLDYMLELAKKLSEDFHFVRVDFFTVASKVYFAELTFTPNSGCEKFTDFSVDKKFGSLFNLPDDQYVKKEN